MIYPNGSTEIRKLLKMIHSDEYEVWYEANSAHRKRITTQEDLVWAINEEFSGNGKICYDITKEYCKKHPVNNEVRKEITENSFEWEYAGKKNYKITTCTYLGETPKHIPFELVQFDSDFNSSCFQLGSWERNKEGYEFHSCGSRMFDYIPKKDLKEVWKGIKKADKFLNAKFLNEE
jgi:hypothetical protein